MDQFPIVLSEEDGNMEVRQTWAEGTNVMQNFGESKVVPDLVPDDFKILFEQFD